MPRLAMGALAALGALPGLAAESVDSRLKPGEGYALSQTPSDSNGSGWVIRNENGLRVHVRMETSSGKVPRPGDTVIIVRNINAKAGSAIIDADPAVNALRRFAPGSQIELNFFHDRQGRYGPTHLKVVKVMPVRATITGKVAEKLAEPGQVMIEVVSLPKDADGPKGVAVLFKVGDAPDPADKDKRVPDAEQLKVLAGLKEGDAVEVAYRICPEFLTIESIRKAGDKDGPPAESPKPDPKDPKKEPPPPKEKPKTPEDDF
jgi:hypothetical protein